jgi:hypothetical protein
LPESKSEHPGLAFLTSSPWSGDITSVGLLILTDHEDDLKTLGEHTRLAFDQYSRKFRKYSAMAPTKTPGGQAASEKFLKKEAQGKLAP